MPVLILPAAGALTVAAVALVILLAWALFGKSIAHVIPDWHIPLLGNLQRAALTLVAAAGQAMWNAAEAAVRPIGHALYYPVHAFSLLIQSIVSLAREIHATAHWITRVQAPNIYRRAVHAIDGRLAAVYRRISAVHVAVDNYVHYAIVHDAALAKADAHGVRVWAGHQLAALVHRISHVHVLVDNYVHYAIVHDAALAAADTARLKAWAAVRLTHLSTRVSQLRHDLVASTAHVLAQAHAYADRAAHDARVDAINQLNGSTAVHITDEWHGLREEVDALTGVIGSDFPAVAADLRDIPVSVPQILPVALSAALAAAIPALRLARDCTVPNCRNLSKFGRDLVDMESAVEGVDIFAWLATMVADPAAGADNLVADLYQPVETIVTDTRDLIGV